MELKFSNESLRRATETPWHTSREDYAPVVEFNVDFGQIRQVSAWEEEHNKTCPYHDDGSSPSPKIGAIGGRLTFSFTPTSLGTITKVTCACGSAVDLTEYGEW